MRPYPIGNGTVSARIPREFAALLDALQLEGSNTDALLELDDSDWRRLLEFCDLAHLALPLSQAKLAGIPEWVIRRLDKNLADNGQRFERVRAAYSDAAAALGQAGVPHLVLKGFTQAPDYVRDPHIRMQSDIDIYCPQFHIETARAALMRIGYLPVDGPDYSHADHLPTLSLPGNWKWQGNSYDPEMPPSIELHFCLWNEKVSLIEIPEVVRFWDRRVVRRLGAMEFSALSAVDQLGFLALHILRGVLSGDWVVHHTHELATFLHTRARDVEFWSEWKDTHSIHLRKVEAIAFGLARSWFSCALPEVARVEIDGLPGAQRRWLNRLGSAPLEVMFRRNKDGRILQLLLTKSQKTRQSALWRAIVPARIAGPNEPTVRIKYRRASVDPRSNRSLNYLGYLGNRFFVNARANASFLFHGSTLWLSTRTLTSQFWLLLSASFFLTWTCP